MGAQQVSDDAVLSIYATDYSDEFINGVRKILRNPLMPTSGLSEARNTLNSIQVVLEQKSAP